MSVIDFQAVFQALDAPVLVVQSSGRIAFANAAAARLFALPLTEFPERPLVSLFASESWHRLDAALEGQGADEPLALVLSNRSAEVHATFRASEPGGHWVLNLRPVPKEPIVPSKVLFAPPVIAARAPAASMPAAAATERDLATALRSLGDGVITTDHEGRVTFVNDVAERLTGWRSSEAVGRPLGEVFLILNEGDRTIAESPLARVVREGNAVELSNHTALVARTGTVSSIENSGAPIRDAEGALVGVVLTFRDVTQMRRAANRRRFLAQAAATLAASLDYEETLTNVAHLAVPRLADWCVVYVLDAAGAPQPLAVAHVDSTKLKAARELTQRYAAEPGAPSGVQTVLRTGQSDLRSYLDDEALAAVAVDKQHLRLLQTLGTRSVMVVPLVAHGRALGAVSFVVADGEHRYEEADLLMAEELAARAAFAIDNARLHRSLQEGEERIRLVLESAGEGILGIDPQGRCTFANPSCARLLGFPSSEALVGRGIDELVSHQDDEPEPPRPPPKVIGVHGSHAPPMRRIDELCLEGRGVHVPEERMARADASTFWAECWSYPIEREGQRVGAVITFVDITERKRAEEEHARVLVELEEAVRLRDDFLSIASHELRTPLTPLQLHVQGIQRIIRRGKLADLSPTELSEKLDAVARQIHRMERLVDSLLDIARITGKRMQLQLEELELSALVRELVARHREELDRAGCTVEVSIEGPAVGLWDRLRLDQVVSNLLGNALKFGAGKAIDVSVKVDRAHQRARLAVRDHGIGIAAEDQRRIFERFERAVPSRHYGGFGLGLWIVRQIVEAMGGTIRVESTPGDGAEFVVELPLASADSLATHQLL